MKCSKKIQSLFGFLVSLAIIIWMVVKVDWQVVGSELHRVVYWMFIPCTAVFALHMFIRALRWRALLPNGKDVPIRSLMDGLMLGNLASFILPLRAGEFVRPLIITRQSITRQSEVPYATGLVSVIIERFFDLSAVLLSFGILVQFMTGIPPELYHGAVVLTGMAACILAVMVVGSFAPEFVLKLLNFFLRPLPQGPSQKLEKFARDFLQGAAVLKRPAALGMVILLTALVWLSNYVVFSMYLSLVNVEPSVTRAVAVAVVLALVVAAPSAPGFIGVYQLGSIWGFALFSLPRETAMTFAIVTHLYQYVVFILYGVFSLLRGTVGLRDLRGPAAEIDASANP